MTVAVRSSAHPSVVFCTGCGTHGVRPLMAPDAPGSVVAVSCPACGLVVSLAELARARRAPARSGHLRVVAGR